MAHRPISSAADRVVYAPRRMAAVLAVEAWVYAGYGRESGVFHVAQIFGVHPRTVWRWIRVVAGLPRPEWLRQLHDHRFNLDTPK